MRYWAVAVVAGFVGFATQASAQSGDAAKGQRIFNQQCRSCHTVEKDGPTVTGPNLHGLFGRKAGTAAGYDASDAMKNSGIVWDEATLADYIRDPKTKVPATKMMFSGIKQPAPLADLVAYLKQATPESCRGRGHRRSRPGTGPRPGRRTPAGRRGRRCRTLRRYSRPAAAGR